MHESFGCVPGEWLGGETSVEQIEAEELQGRNERWLAEWRSFISQMQPGDQLRHFLSPPETWLRLAGLAGYAIVRQGKVVDSLVTILS